MIKKLLGFIAFTICSTNLIFADNLLIEIDDPAITEALKKFNNVKKELSDSCSAKTKTDFNELLNCMCQESNVKELYKANKEKIESWADLLKRKPELENKMVKVKGVFGNHYVSWDVINKGRAKSTEEFKQSLGCK